MARRTDPTKIEEIRKAAMGLIVDRGYSGASIGAIAKKAGVSTGYLYRHYNSKRELADDLIQSNFKRLNDIFLSVLDESKTVEDILYQFVYSLFNVAIERPVLAKFFNVLVFDPKFREEQKNNAKGHKERPVIHFIEGLIKIGNATGEIGHKTSVQDIMIVVFTIPFAHISYSLSLGPDKEDFVEERVERIVELCLNALK